MNQTSFLAEWVLATGPGALWFAAAAVLLGALDISMPRRDTIGVGGALDAVALVVAGPQTACLTAVCGASASWTTRSRAAGLQRFAIAVTARLGAVLVSLLLMRALAGVAPSALSGWPPRVAAVIVYLLTQAASVQALTALTMERPAWRAITGGIGLQGPLLLAQASSALLAVIIYPSLGPWSLLLAVALLLLIRQSYSLLLEMRETFRTTIEVLVEAAEGQGSAKRGHAERTAQIARVIAAGCGFSSAEVERIGYAALLHDIGEIGTEPPEGRAPGSPRSSSAVIKDVHFFSDVLDVIRLCDGATPAQHPPADSALMSAFIVALASDIDDRANGLALSDSHVSLVAPKVSSSLKAKAVGVAVRLGFGTPALS